MTQTDVERWVEEAYSAGFDGDLREKEKILQAVKLSFMGRTGNGCGICGCFLVTIRPRFPGGEPRDVCPTCLQARIEMALQALSPSYYESKKAKP